MDKKNIPISLIGSGALKEGIKEIRESGFKKIFIVVSETLLNHHSVEELKKTLVDNNLEYYIFSKSNISPNITTIKEGTSKIIENSCDLILSLGGRDTTMCARGLAMSLSCEQEKNQIKCYTGGEIPFASIVMNSWINDNNGIYHFNNLKVSINKNVNPFMVMVDSELIRDLPKNAMAAIGIDSLTHSVEAIVSMGSNQVSDSCAFEAIKLLSNHLEKFILGQDNFEIREQITYANYLANMAFTNINAVKTIGDDSYFSPAFDLENIDIKMSKIAKTMGIELQKEELKTGITNEIQRISRLIEVAPSKRKVESIIYN